MAYTRRRPVDSFQGASPALGVRQEVLSGLNGGYNGYTDPVLLSPQFWLAAGNIYSGQHGQIRRARFAQILNAAYDPVGAYPAQPFSSQFIFGDPTPQQVLLFDGGTGPGANMYAMALSDVAAPAMALRNNASRYLGEDAGPWSRVAIVNMVLEMNGLRKQKGRGVLLNTVEDLGLNSPTVAPFVGATLNIFSAITGSVVTAVRFNGIVTVTTNAGAATGLLTGMNVTLSGLTGTDPTFNSATGTCFGPITWIDNSHFSFPQLGTDTTDSSGTGIFRNSVAIRTVGRSYQWAEENANTGHVGPPSPATFFWRPNGTYVSFLIQREGSANLSIGSPNVVGTLNGATGETTAFSQADVGKQFSVLGTDFSSVILSVTDAQHLTLANNSDGNYSPFPYIIYDPQTTHIRLYATSDGGSVYQLEQRNAITLATNGNNPGPPPYANFGGWLFFDTADAEPPSFPFTTEQTQRYNVPPPIGKYLLEYQSRVIVFGVLAALQSFFYSNIEATVVGQGPESYAPLNQVTLSLGSANLNGGAPLPSGLILWSDKHDMFKLVGLLSDNAAATELQQGSSIQRLPYKLGCASAYATAVTSLGAFWLSSDREVWLYTDNYAPKNVGKPIQDLLDRINPAQLTDVRFAYYKTRDKNWLCIACALDAATTNNTMLALDLDLLASNGQPSYFTFDMATNQPSWYVFNVPCESLAVGFDNNRNNHLYGSDVRIIRDLVYRAGDFSMSPAGVGGFGNLGEEPLVANQLLLHSLGNEQPEALKRMEWIRYVTTDTPAGLLSNGWQFNVNSTEDDFYTFANPQIAVLVPGVDSPGSQLPEEFGPSKFTFGGVKYSIGRRFQIGLNFPTGPGDWALREIQCQYRALNVR